MIFNLKLHSVAGKPAVKANSIIVKFFVKDKYLKKNFATFKNLQRLSFNKNQENNFFNEDVDSLRNYNTSGKPDLVFIQKIKLDDNFTVDYFRNYFAGLIPRLEKENLKNLRIFLPDYKEFKKYFGDETYFYQTMVEGIYLGNYNFSKYKSGKKEKKNLSIELIGKNQIKVREALKVSSLISKAVYFSRDLVNEPAITLTPAELANRTRKELTKDKIRVKVFNEAELKKRKMNAILTVGSSSSNSPKMIVINYKPTGGIKKKIALVGKGVTYDTGGLSIKPTSGLLEMKADMAGAASVIGIIKAAAKAKLPVELIGVIPAVENVISAKSYKPSDVIKSASGKTIEVKDTDAEGRIILSDALHYASQQKPDEIMDFATLTGSVVSALGEIAAGLFTQNDKLAGRLEQSGKNTFERVWRLPFWNDYNKMIESDIADVSNLGPRWGGAITAGKFLEHFVDKNIPWAHLDIAGPAIKHKSNNYTEKYDTGFGVRLIFDYLKQNYS